jgi:hypothetical protein
MNEKITQMAFVPYDKMEELLQKIDHLSQTILNTQGGKAPLGDFISEKEAKELLGKGTTWFWNKRQSGELTGRKAGNKWYYKRSEILSFIENGKKSL